jgi:hypothetical protein
MQRRGAVGFINVHRELPDGERQQREGLNSPQSSRAESMIGDAVMADFSG